MLQPTTYLSQVLMTLRFVESGYKYIVDITKRKVETPENIYKPLENLRRIL